MLHNFNMAGDNYDWAFPYIVHPIHIGVEVGSRDLADAIRVSTFYDCDVLAFEPDKRLFAQCLEISKTYDRVKVRPEALFDSNGEIDFYVYTEGSSSLFEHQSLPKDIVKVPVKRFDSLRLPPDLLFVDAQSSELRILKGFGRQLLEVKYVILETGFYSACENNGENFDQINKFLRNNGFKFLATSVSGKGKIRFWIMRARGITYNVRKRGISGFTAYSGFFDVIYKNARIN